MSKETKRLKFDRLAPKRVEVVREKLCILGNCSNPDGYVYDQKIAQRLFGLLFAEFMRCARGFGLDVKATINDIPVRMYPDSE